MHEVAIAQEIKEILLDELRKRGQKKIKKVNLVFGELTSVVPEAMKFAFEVISKDTPLEGAMIKVRISRIKASCRSCGNEFTVKDLNYCCPLCSGQDLKIIRGKEMNVQSMETE